MNTEQIITELKGFLESNSNHLQISHTLSVAVERVGRVDLRYSEVARGYYPHTSIFCLTKSYRDSTAGYKGGKQLYAIVVRGSIGCAKLVNGTKEFTEKRVKLLANKEIQFKTIVRTINDSIVN